MNKIKSRENLQFVIVEVEHHAELIKTLFDVLSLKRFSITLITTPDIYRKTQLEGERAREEIAVFLKSEHESVADLFSRAKGVFESADVIYFNTVRHHWKALNSIPLEGLSIVRVHNAHCDLAPGTHFYKPLINAIPIMFHFIRVVLIKREWSLKKRFFEKIDYIMFPNKTITEYVKNKGWVASEKIMEPILPFGYLSDGSYEVKSDNSWVTIGITGKVTNRRKDYGLVRSALKECICELNAPVNLVFLGRAGDKEARKIISEFEDIEPLRFNLEYSLEYLSSEEFEEKMSRVDFLISPIQTSIRCRKYHEVYGKSKVSGVENDVLAFRKPLLVNASYHVDGGLSAVVDQFEETPEALAFKIREWVNGRVFDEKKRNFVHLDEYKKEVVAEKFYMKCRELVNYKSSKSLSRL